MTNRMTDNYSALKCLIGNGRGQNNKSSGGSFEEANDIFSPTVGHTRLVSAVQTFIFYTSERGEFQDQPLDQGEHKRVNGGLNERVQ